ncbi:MAG: hypothetical protein H8E55_49475 [Pelagibacterales bacterium]|nr:hypothetical protein [Pelagibacterales bacterium]
MTDKEFIKWLDNFLEKSNIKDIEWSHKMSDIYNHSTVLKSIYDTLQTVKNKSEYPRTGGLSQDTGPRN